MDTRILTAQFPLRAGERELWAGMPRQGFRFQASDIVVIPFSIVWVTFAVSWEVIAITSGAPWPMLLLGIPFVLVGAHLVIGRYFEDRLRRRRTIYAVTTDRIIIRSGLFRPVTLSLDLATMRDLSLDESADGRGTVYIGGRPRVGRKGDPAPDVPCLDSIADARRVFDLIRDAQREAAHRPPALAP